jgi:hypothetical protein
MMMDVRFTPLVLVRHLCPHPHQCRESLALSPSQKGKAANQRVRNGITPLPVPRNLLGRAPKVRQQECYTRLDSDLPRGVIK